MQVKRLDTGHMGTNTYVLYDGEQGTCAVFDPADDKPVLDFMERNGLRCTHILLTHTHFDHIMGVARLKAKTGALVCAHELDAAGLYDPIISLANMSACAVEPCRADVELKHGDVVNAAGFELHVLHTPGHTAGGVCYVLFAPEKAIFSGDTLFYRSVGRFDLPRGDGDALLNSIRSKLFALDGDYIVYPGHGPATRLGDERAANPYAALGERE